MIRSIAAETFVPRTANGWNQVSPVDSGVTVRMPGRPTYRNHVSQSHDGAREYSSSVLANSRMGIFGVLVVHWEGGIVGDPLPATRENARRIFEQGEIRAQDSRRLAVAGFYGREDIGVNQQGVQIVLRQYVGSDRVVLVYSAVRGVPQQRSRIAAMFQESVTLDPQYALFASAGTGRSDGQWTPLYIPESAFGVQMPVAPAVREQEMTIASTDVDVTSFESRDSWGRYAVRVVTFPDVVPGGAFEEVRGRLHLVDRIRSAESSGYPGAVYTTDRGPERTWARIFRTDGRIYVVQARGPRAAASAADGQARLRNFFNSFRIL